MKKQVLILSGSPRKGGNSDTLCEQFIKGAEEAGHDTEKIYLDDMKMGFCKACYSCKKNGTCFQKDDVEAILEKMINADVIVMATPVYYYTMNGQMKTLIDRALPRYYTEVKISDKNFYFIATAAEKKETMERTIDGLRGFTDCLPNANIKGIIYGANAWQLGDIQGNTAMDEAYEMGKQV
jgi:multimeric flavodoxin WrbA